MYRCAKGCEVLDGKAKEKRKIEAIAKKAPRMSPNFLIFGHRAGAKAIGRFILEMHKSPINGVLFV